MNVIDYCSTDKNFFLSRLYENDCNAKSFCMHFFSMIKCELIEIQVGKGLIFHRIWLKTIEDGESEPAVSFYSFL